MTALVMTPLRWLAIGVCLSQGALAFAQVEDPAEMSTTPAEAALTHYPHVGDADHSSVAAAPLRFRPASERTDIGRATQSLLAMQRQAPAHTPRWIDGDQASRSYARYLKSFEREIPEKYETGVKTDISNK